jgi:hypothetical protein
MKVGDPVNPAVAVAAFVFMKTELNVGLPVSVHTRLPSNGPDLSNMLDPDIAFVALKCPLPVNVFDLVNRFEPG